MLPPPLTSEEVAALTPEQLVNKLWDKRIRNRVHRALIGGITKRETYGVQLRPDVRDAIIAGLQHWSPKVRWWCLNLIDHHDDGRCTEAAARLLYDPIPRVRKMALHALECERCNPDSQTIAARQRLLALHQQS